MRRGERAAAEALAQQWLRACRAVALAVTCDEADADDEEIAFAADGSLAVTSEGGRKKSPATFARLACALE